MEGAGGQNLVLKEEGGMRRMKEDGRSRRAEPGIEGRGRMKEDGRGRRTGPGMKEEGG